MSDETRGHRIKQRRLALGIDSIRKFHEATGIDRQALSKAEEGAGSRETLDRVESWLDRMEAEVGMNDPDPHPEPIRFTFHDVYGIGELIVEGPVDRSEEIIAAAAKLLAEVRSNRGQAD